MTTLIDKTALFCLLESYHHIIEEGIKKDLKKHFGPPTELQKACAYALFSGGKRFRPTITLLIAKTLGSKNALDAAIAVEYFHTASLIADDLPCMDDDDERRSRPSTHKVFGEATAILSTYALIAAGYRLITQNCQQHTNPNIYSEALKTAVDNTGILGATGGQFLDLFTKNLNLETLKEIHHKKTGTLFEIAFVFGWLFGGGNLALLDKVKELAAHFGLAFQIADDLGDLLQDEQSINLAKSIGLEEASKLLEEEKKLTLSLAKELSLDSPELLSLLATIV